MRYRFPGIAGMYHCLSSGGISARFHSGEHSCPSRHTLRIYRHHCIQDTHFCRSPRHFFNIFFFRRPLRALALRDQSSNRVDCRPRSEFGAAP
jgi:hypothetical protein